MRDSCSKTPQRHCRLAWLVLFTLWALWTGLASAQNLPELNDSASQILNAEDEIILGRALMADARKRLKIIDDPILENYVQALTEQLARHSSRKLPDLQVSVARNPVINAFAAPGGQIAVNTGLLAATQSEGEFASVIAHEISHHSQRHIPRMLENAKKLSLPSTAALIGGILIGGQAGLATITAVRAAVISNQLAYSRSFEQEADAAGMKLLASAGYDPMNMPTFFGRLERQSQIQGGDAPEFLRTHPLSNNRISDAKSRVRSLGLDKQERQDLDTLLDFDTAQARAGALYGEPLSQIIAQFRVRLAQNADAEDFANTYGLALALMRDDQPQAALAAFATDYSQPRMRHLMQLTQAEIMLKDQQYEPALAHLNALKTVYPDNLAIGLTTARVLKHLGRFDDAFQQGRRMQRRHDSNPYVSLLLADVAGAKGELADAAFYKAQYYFKIGRYQHAITTLSPHLNAGDQNQSDYLLASMKDLLRQINRAQARIDALDI